MDSKWVSYSAQRTFEFHSQAGWWPSGFLPIFEGGALPAWDKLSYPQDAADKVSTKPALLLVETPVY